MEHIVKFERGFDCIAFECLNKSETCVPGKGGSHGKHGLSIRFVVKGDDGAVQFLLFTGWLPQYTSVAATLGRYSLNWGSSMMPADLGYHSKKPMYDDHTPTESSCEFCDGAPCYYDGSGLNASDAMYALVNGGDEALWAFLDAYYAAVFEGGGYPVPTEYPMPPRSSP